MVLRRRAGGQKSVWPRWQEYSSWCNTRPGNQCCPPLQALVSTRRADARAAFEEGLDHGPLRPESALGIGPGGAVANLERVRFCSGLLFHSLAFHAAKQALLEGFSAMKDGIQAIEKEETPLLVYTSEWASCSQVHKALQDLGYTCTEQTHIRPKDHRASGSCGSAGHFMIIRVDAWEVFDPWNRRSLIPEEVKDGELLYVTGSGSRTHDRGDKRPRGQRRLPQGNSAVGVRMYVQIDLDSPR